MILKAPLPNRIPAVSKRFNPWHRLVPGQRMYAPVKIALGDWVCVVPVHGWVIKADWFGWRIWIKWDYQWETDEPV